MGGWEKEGLEEVGWEEMGWVKEDPEILWVEKLVKNAFQTRQGKPIGKARG